MVNKIENSSYVLISTTPFLKADRVGARPPTTRVNILFDFEKMVKGIAKLESI